MSDVAGAEVAVHWICNLEGRAQLRDSVSDEDEELVQGGALAKGHFVDLTHSLSPLNVYGQKIGLGAVFQYSKSELDIHCCHHYQL
jgi:hypothetical protein